ncbi:MAG: SigB/SigF/SigG family RNA polymerase sigma factor [Actinomycetota bacterium]
MSDEPSARPGETDEELFVRYRDSGSRALRNELVERNMGLAAHIAKRYTRQGAADDVRQVAMLGLVKAVDRFDPGHGATFSSFAGLTIEGEVKRHFRDRTWSVRVPRSAKELHLLVRNGADQLTQQLGRSPTIEEIATHLQLTRDDVVRGLAAGAAYQVGSIDSAGRLEDDDMSAGDRDRSLSEEDEGFEISDRRDLVAQLLRTLPSRERQIVELRFYGEKSQAEIAEVVGVSQMHVSRLLRRSLEVMRVRLDDT